MPPRTRRDRSSPRAGRRAGPLLAGLAGLAGFGACGPVPDPGAPEVGAAAAPIAVSPLPTATPGGLTGPLSYPVSCAAFSTSFCGKMAYLETCGAAWSVQTPTWESQCFDYNKAQSDQYFAGGVESERVFDKETDTFVSALPPKIIPLPSQQTATKNSWAAQEEVAKFQAATTSWQGDPTTYKRTIDNAGSVTGTGWPIATCENYVYRSFYDVERWLDAINACKGDYRCQVKVSLNGVSGPTGEAPVPGIARREPRDSQGALITDRLAQLPYTAIAQVERDPFTNKYVTDALPKNDFYVGTKFLITPALIKAFEAAGSGEEVQAMFNELSRGGEEDVFYYQMGPTSPTTGGKPYIDEDGRPHRGFKDEWDFHGYMFSHTMGLTDGETREFDRRGKTIREAIMRFADLAKCRTMGEVLTRCGELPNAMAMVRSSDYLPWHGDPFAYRSIVGAITPEAFVMPPAAKGLVGVGSRLQQAALSIDEMLDGGLLTGGQLLGATLSQPGLVVEPSAAMPMSGTLGGGGALGAPGLAKGLAQGAVVARAVARAAAADGRPGGGVIAPAVDVTGPAPYADASAGVEPTNVRGLVELMWTTNPPQIDRSAPYPRLDCSNSRLGPSRGDGGRDGGTGLKDDLLHTYQIRYEVCQTINLLLDEWGRKLGGRPSCLDPKKVYCDWQPKHFVDRFVTRYVGYGEAAKEYEYRECKRWTAGGDLANPKNALDTGPGIPWFERTDLQKIRSVFAKRRAYIEELVRDMPIKGTDTFGSTRVDEQRIGNGDFGGGYAYELGWTLGVFRNGLGAACRVGGNVKASFTADARIFGKKVDILDYASHIVSNENDDGKATGQGHLKVLDHVLFDSKDYDTEDLAQQGVINLKTYPNTTFQTPFEFDGDDPTLFTAAAQVGWVTITVTVGVYYRYGTSAKLYATLPATPNDCDVAGYKMGSVVTPSAELGVWADADVGLAGIIGVGLGVELTLVRIDLPLTVDLQLKTVDNLTNIVFRAGLDLVLTTLKGELSGYLKLFWAKVVSVTFLKWDGFSHTIPIFRLADKKIPLSPLAEGVITPGAGAGEHDTP